MYIIFFLKFGALIKMVKKIFKKSDLNLHMMKTLKEKKYRKNFKTFGEPISFCSQLSGDITSDVDMND